MYFLLHPQCPRHACGDMDPHIMYHDTTDHVGNKQSKLARTIKFNDRVSRNCVDIFLDHFNTFGRLHFEHKKFQIASKYLRVFLKHSYLFVSLYLYLYKAIIKESDVCFSVLTSLYVKWSPLLCYHPLIMQSRFSVSTACCWLCPILISSVFTILGPCAKLHGRLSGLRLPSGHHFSLEC